MKKSLTASSIAQNAIMLLEAIVRLILAPVILVGIYYLFEMGWIVDRIVSIDAPAATLAQQASIQMLEARRAERNFFLLRDAADAKENHDSLTAVTGILTPIRSLQPEEQTTIQSVRAALSRFLRFASMGFATSNPQMAICLASSVPAAGRGMFVVSRRDDTGSLRGGRPKSLS